MIGVSPNRKLSIEWILTIPKNNANSGRFQVWLFESSNTIQFVYGSGIIANPGGASIGLAAGTTDFVSVTSSTNTASKITENNSNTSAIHSGTSYTFSVPVAPGCVSTSSPSASATGVSPVTTLSWTAGTGNPTSYDVYFGTASNPPLVSAGQIGTTFNPDTSKKYELLLQNCPKKFYRRSNRLCH
ncbi:MAG: hypothetical protein IPP51_09135 [Bacteroidetes bacterium]|nr:hypothetical protein [Bacteroidota bacterium]